MAFAGTKDDGHAPLILSPGKARLALLNFGPELKSDGRPKEFVENIHMTSFIRAGSLIGILSLLVLFAAEANIRIFPLAFLISSCSSSESSSSSRVNPRDIEMILTFHTSAA